MDRVRLMYWCSNVLAGLQVPVFAAVEGGLFAEQGIEVEFVRGPTPDWTLRGFSARAKGVAAGDADFGLTSVAYLLAGHADVGARLPVRFIAISHQRNPIIGVVRAEGDLREPADLGGARVASWSMPWYAQEYAGALAHLGVEPPVLVETGGRDLDGALGDREIDVIPVTMDWMTFYDRTTVCPVRIIRLDVPVYTTGLVASDRLPLDLVTRMRNAFVAGHDLHRRRPELGIAAFRRRFPQISEEHIRRNWSLFEPYAFDGPQPGSMDAGRWEETAAYMAATHHLPPFPAEELYRPELLSRPREHAAIY